MFSLQKWIASRFSARKKAAPPDMASQTPRRKIPRSPFLRAHSGAQDDRYMNLSIATRNWQLAWQITAAILAVSVAFNGYYIIAIERDRYCENRRRDLPGQLPVARCNRQIHIAVVLRSAMGAQERRARDFPARRLTCHIWRRRLFARGKTGRYPLLQTEHLRISGRRRMRFGS